MDYNFKKLVIHSYEGKSKSCDLFLRGYMTIFSFQKEIFDFMYFLQNALHFFAQMSQSLGKN